MTIKRKSVTVSVSRTIQLKQYHPATVVVTETADVPADMDVAEVKLDLYKSATGSVTKFLANEMRKHGEEE